MLRHFSVTLRHRRHYTFQKMFRKVSYTCLHVYQISVNYFRYQTDGCSRKCFLQPTVKRFDKFEARIISWTIPKMYPSVLAQFLLLDWYESEHHLADKSIVIAFFFRIMTKWSSKTFRWIFVFCLPFPILHLVVHEKEKDPNIRTSPPPCVVVMTVIPPFINHDYKNAKHQKDQDWMLSI